MNEPGFQPGELGYVANPGERNDVTVSGDESTSYLLEDRGALVTPGDGCRAEDAHRVRCPPIRHPGIVALLGDENDRIRFDIRLVLGDGGPGDDVLIGGPSNDLLIGGEGDDVIEGRGGLDTIVGDESFVGSFGDDTLRGGPGSDLITGGPGRDRLFGGGGDDLLDGDFSAFEVAFQRPRPRRAPDRIRGGGGTDHLVYNFVLLSSRRPRPAPALAISFDGRANDGPRDERDNVASDVERAYSLTTAQVVPVEHGFRVERLRGPDQRPVKGRLGARIYRLRGRGSRGAQTGLFEGAEFDFRARGRAGAPVELDLKGGAFDRCANRSGAAASGRRPGRLIRRLLARVRGLFRVNARYVSLTVHGTAFSIAERCSETRVRVIEGVVEIRSRGRRRLLRKGDSLVIRAP
jgi:Ca2+-binding RTX toxin-like protein